jgi:hypothetical protein
MKSLLGYDDPRGNCDSVAEWRYCIRTYPSLVGYHLPIHGNQAPQVTDTHHHNAVNVGRKNVFLQYHIVKIRINSNRCSNQISGVLSRPSWIIGYCEAANITLTSVVSVCRTSPMSL